MAASGGSCNDGRVRPRWGRRTDALPGYLTNRVKSPRFTVCYRWSEGTAANWGNRCTRHMVLNDFTDERIVQRVTVVGDRVR